MVASCSGWVWPREISPGTAPQGLRVSPWGSHEARPGARRELAGSSAEPAARPSEPRLGTALLWLLHTRQHSSPSGFHSSQAASRAQQCFIAVSRHPRKARTGHGAWLRDGPQSPLPARLRPTGQRRRTSSCERQDGRRDCDAPAVTQAVAHSAEGTCRRGLADGGRRREAGFETLPVLQLFSLWVE